MRLDIVTPERQLISEEVTSVQVPGMQGDMTIMDNHAPLVTTLRPGVVTVTGGKGEKFVVTGGFCEVSGNAATILAEMAVPAGDASRDMLQKVLDEATAAVETAGDDTIMAARQRVADVNDLILRHAM